MEKQEETYESRTLEGDIKRIYDSMHHPHIIGTVGDKNRYTKRQEDENHDNR